MRDDTVEKLGLGMPYYHAPRPIEDKYLLDSVYAPDGKLEALSGVLEGFLTPWTQSCTSVPGRTTRYFQETYTGIKDQDDWDIVPDAMNVIIHSTEFRQGVDKIIYDVLLKRMVTARWTSAYILSTRFTIEQSTDEWTPYFGYITRPDILRLKPSHIKPDIMTPYDCEDMSGILAPLLELQNEQAY